MSSPPSGFGRDLLARAHDRGVTSEQLATLLNLPVAAIRRLTSPHDLDQHTSATLRALAQRLDLPWPQWLTADEPRWPPPAQPDTQPDPARVHTVLAAAFGHGLHLSEIAHILGWTLDRVRSAVAVLTTRVRPGGGTRLHHDGDTVALELVPGMLGDTARHRLHQILHVYGLGPDPKVLHIVYQVIGMYAEGPQWLYQDQDLLDQATGYGLLIQDTADIDGTVTNLRLHPDVEYSLGITQYRYPPEKPRDPPSTGS